MTEASAAWRAEQPGLPRRGGDERRGQDVGHTSYFSRLRRERRATIFRMRESGATGSTIAEAVGMTEHEVQQVLMTERRRRG